MVVLAAGIAALGRQPVGYIGQCLLVLIGLLLALLSFLPQHLPLERFGEANAVTLVRAGLAALMAGWLGRGALSMEISWLIVVLAVLALLLDGVDGWLARRHALASTFGARFDMEIDAFSILIMAILVYQSGKAGAWVILSGLYATALSLSVMCFPTCGGHYPRANAARPSVLSKSLP